MNQIPKILLLVYLFCCGVLQVNAQNQAHKKPNVLLIITDDMNGYGVFHEYPGVKMPHFDKFRETAISFTNAHCPAPACNPSRAATFSGFNPNVTGSYENGADPWRQSDLLKEVTSLPELFHNQGYTTYAQGKIFHAKLTEGREEAMFDAHVYKGGFKPFPNNKEEWVDGKFFSQKAWEGPDEDFPDNINAESMMKFLGEAHDKPFLAIYGLWRPHTPFTAPKRFFDMYKGLQFDLPAGYRDGDLSDVTSLSKKIIDPFSRFEHAGKGTEETWKQMIGAYAACNSFADWNVGRVIEALDNSAYADNTIVIIWSDNGFHCGEKDHWGKFMLWEQSTRVPMFVRYPKMKNAGKVCTKPVSLVDIYPTLIEYCQLQSPERKLDGNSMLPLLENIKDKNWTRPAFTANGKQWATLRTERFRYIRYPDGTEELYDHKKDGFEFKNLADDPKYNKVKKEIAQWLPEEWQTPLLLKNGIPKTTGNL
ncbi:sulfatase [Limibacter armeniacum]|uniref:sulfatase n=1 Tax=Limibacter armeniacum TaxID=466084 RepID=UPI002FE6612A